MNPAGALKAVRGHNWGALDVQNDSITLRSTIDSNAPILSVPVQNIVNVGGGKTELAVETNAMAELIKSTASPDDIGVTSIRFAVPKTCVGFEETEEAGKELQEKVQAVVSSSNGGAASSAAAAAASVVTDVGTEIGTFKDVSISQPSGMYNITMSTTFISLYHLQKKATFTIATQDVTRMFLLPIPDHLSKYLVMVLSKPLRVGATTHPAVVLTFSDGLVVAEENPWKCTLTTDEELHKHFPSETCLITPMMHGALSELVAKVFKTLTKCKMTGSNNEFVARSGLKGVSVGFAGTSCLPCTYKGGDGLFYILKEHIVFLHRPATVLPYSDILRCSIDNTGTSTFVLEVYARKKGMAVTSTGRAAEDKHIFALPKGMLSELVAYLRKKCGEKIVSGGGDEEDDEEEDEDESDDEDFNPDDESESDDDFDDEDDDDSEDEGARKKKSKKEKKHKKDKKSKKEKKHKKDKKDKKSKKEKKDKKRKREDDE